MNPTEVKEALEDRDVLLGSPADEAGLARFERELGLRLDGYIRRIYAAFDGFLDCDHGSQYLVWPLERIGLHINERMRIGEDWYYPIGDFMIDTDLLMCCLEQEARPIFLRYEKRQVASSFSGFLDNLVAGQYDFL